MENYFLTKESEEEIRKLNKEISEDFSVKLKNLRQNDLRKSLINYLKLYSDLPEIYYVNSSEDQLVLLFYAVLTGLKVGTLLLLSYPNFSEREIEDLTFVLKERNLLSPIIDYLVLTDEDNLHKITNRLRRGEACFKILYETSETVEQKNFFQTTDSRFDDFFLKVLDYYDGLSEEAEANKAEIIPFKKFKDS